MNCPKCKTEMVVAQAVYFMQAGKAEKYDYCRTCKKELKEIEAEVPKTALGVCYDITEQADPLNWGMVPPPAVQGVSVVPTRVYSAYGMAILNAAKDMIEVIVNGTPRNYFYRKQPATAAMGSIRWWDWDKSSMTALMVASTNVRQAAIDLKNLAMANV